MRLLAQQPPVPVLVLSGAAAGYPPPPPPAAPPPAPGGEAVQGPACPTCSAPLLDHLLYTAFLRVVGLRNPRGPCLGQPSSQSSRVQFHRRLYSLEYCPTARASSHKLQQGRHEGVPRTKQATLAMQCMLLIFLWWLIVYRPSSDQTTLYRAGGPWTSTRAPAVLQWPPGGATTAMTATRSLQGA